MPDFRIVNQVDPVTFEDAKAKMSVELREALVRAFARARLPEDDPLYSILVAQAELLNAAFDAQSSLMNGTLEGFLSARQAENKKLATLVLESGTSIKQATNAIAGQTKASAEQIQALKDILHKELRDHREAGCSEMRDLKILGQSVESAAYTLATKVKRLGDLKNLFISGVFAVGLVLGCAMAVVVQHLAPR